MKKGLIPVTLGVAVTMAGLSVDANQSKQRSFISRSRCCSYCIRCNRYVKRIVRKGIGKIIYPIPFLSKYLLYYEYNLNNKLAI